MSMSSASFDNSAKGDGLIEKLVTVNRNAKVVKGGRVFSFSAVVVVGNGKGKVGVGRGKSKEVPLAIQKALEAARKNMVSIELNGDTLFHPVKAKHAASRIIMLPAAEGTGIIAGASMRAVFEVIGIRNILSKCIGSTNPVNVVYATIKGLQSMLNPAIVNEKLS